MAACTAVGRGATNEQHWRERSSALLAPLRYAANLSGRPIAEVLRWVLRQDLGPAGAALEDHDGRVANDVLVGIAKTDARERSSIFSATAGVLAACNADATQASSEYLARTWHEGGSRDVPRALPQSVGDAERDQPGWTPALPAGLA